MNSYDKITNDEELIIFSPIFLFRKNKIKLYKTNNYNNLKIKFHKKLINSTNLTDVQILKNKIKNFLLVMNSKCKNFNSTIFYKNFRKTCFNLNNLSSEIIDGVDGSVKFSTFVNIFKLKRFSASYHELLHLSSLKKGNKIFEPLNEGYTQLLEERYFGEADLSYYYEVKIMKILELIIGKDELEKLYFSGNFINLKYLFKSKNPDADLTVLYQDMYHIFEIERNNKFIEQSELLEKCLNNVFETLLYCFLNNANNNTIDNIESLKKIFCFAIEIEKEKQKNRIYTIKEENFYEIVNQYKKKNYR